LAQTHGYDDEPWNDHRIGRDQVHLYYKVLLAASADFRIEVKDRYTTDEAVIPEVTISGTLTGAWRGLPATGKSISFPLCGIFTFDQEDRLLGEKIYYDRATVFTLADAGIDKHLADKARKFATRTEISRLDPATLQAKMGSKSACVFSCAIVITISSNAMPKWRIKIHGRNDQEE
jgi:steroid delta-isomerase-like uncharacterized protein